MAQNSKQVEHAEQIAKGDNVLLGMLFMLAFSFCIPFADSLLKILTASVELMTLIAIRYVLQFLFMFVPMVWHKKGVSHLWSLSRGTLWRLFWRTFAHILSIVGMYYALTYMPLADTIAIAFVFPLLMMLTGYIFMGEQVGPNRFIAAIIGFIGTLLVIQPNFVEVGLTALWPVGVAICFVVFSLVTRQMSRDIDPISIQVASAAMALPMIFVPVLLVYLTGLEGFGASLFSLHMPAADSWPLLIAVGFLGALGHLLMTASLRFAPASTLAPMQYLEIPFATFIGWLFFRELPNQLATIGIVITIGAGLYIIYREQKTQRQNV